MRTLTFVFACLVLVIPCQAEIITVDDDGPVNFNNIQDAINYSWHGDTVIVNPGTYHENVYFNGRAITLTSQDPNDPNVVESTIIRADSSYSVTFDFGESSDSVLTGFTITGRGILCYASSPTITKNIVRDCATGGVYGQYSAAPIISDNTINSNSNRGIYDSDGIITNNTISDNRGGVAYCDGTISYNTIVNNDIVGDGAGLYDCDATITNNIISNNYCNNTGGGLYGCDGEIIDNIITDNYAGNGAGLRDCTGTISNNIIAGNQAQTAGGGLHYCIGNISNNIITGNKSGNYGGGLNGCGVSIYNNTIVGNIALQNGGALYECNGSVHNNIIAFNKASSIGGIYGPCNNSYNAFWMNEGGNFGGGATVGPGDIYVAPLFAADGYWDPNGTPEDTSDDFWVDGDYHLKSEAGRWDPNSETWVIDGVTSRCIDAGNPNSDWTAELWPNGKWVNMGAYGGTPQASMSLSDTGNIADLNIDGFVDYLDMIVLTKEWLDRDILLSGDLSRDGIVNLVDFAIFANNWQVPRPGQASNPNPANGAEYVSTDVDLNWTAGLYATSHDVYFGTSSPLPFIRNQTATTFEPGSLATCTMYYWRIDEVNPSGKTTGTVWSFDTGSSPSRASNPNPANGAEYVSTEADLSWTGSWNATSRDVYFGTSYPPQLIRNQTGTTFEPGTMTPSTTYYWRIDEFNPCGTTSGPIWEFTTAPPV